MEHGQGQAQGYEAWLAAALQEAERRAVAQRQERALQDEKPRDQAGTPEGDTTGAEYLADHDRTKTTGYNAVPHHAKQPPHTQRIARVRREAGQRPPKTTRAADEE